MVRRAERTDRRLPVVALAAAALAGGCRAAPATVIVVEVWSDLEVPREMDAVRVGVTSTAETLDLPFALAAGPAAGHRTLPLRVALTPGAAKDASFSVRVAGSLVSAEKVAQEARVAFLPGQARVLAMFLARACQGVSCMDPAYTCDRGKCTLPKERKPEDLPKFDPGKPPDGAPAPDAGADPAVEAGPDAPADVATDTPADAAADLAPEVGVEKTPDLATDAPPVDLPADLPVDAPPDLPADPPADAPVDTPPDLPADLPPDSPAGTPPSCAGLPATCGLSGSEDCCASGLVPGGTYHAYPVDALAHHL